MQLTSSSAIPKCEFWIGLQYPIVQLLEFQTLWHWRQCCTSVCDKNSWICYVLKNFHGHLHARRVTWLKWTINSKQTIPSHQWISKLPTFASDPYWYPVLDQCKGHLSPQSATGTKFPKSLLPTGLACRLRISRARFSVRQGAIGPSWRPDGAELRHPKTSELR